MAYIDNGIEVIAYPEFNLLFIQSTDHELHLDFIFSSGLYCQAVGFEILQDEWKSIGIKEEHAQNDEGSAHLH